MEELHTNIQYTHNTHPRRLPGVETAIFDQPLGVEVLPGEPRRIQDDIVFGVAKLPVGLIGELGVRQCGSTLADKSRDKCDYIEREENSSRGEDSSEALKSHQSKRISKMK